MPTRALTRPTMLPSVFEDFFKPLGQWFDDGGLVNKVITTPSVNIIENPCRLHCIHGGSRIKERGL